MGKMNGFLEYARIEKTPRSIEKRITDYDELYEPFQTEERRKQAARCMNCGVPLCQSAMELAGAVTGCPLHNFIPEFNDELYRGHIQEALARLLKTNPFPEFTGRVCPALCEKACICGMNDTPVTIHDNECYIIEEAFANGWMSPQRKNKQRGKRVAIIGSGPSGLTVAECLNKRGHEVHVYEREAYAGGLLMYGIPNMKLDKTIVQRRITLMQQEGVNFHLNCNIGKDTQFQTLLNQYDALAICCGAKQPRDLNVEGRKHPSILFAVDYLSAVTKMLLHQGADKDNLYNAKDKKVIVVGGGDTGNDCVATCIRQGCASIVQLEMMPQPPLQRMKDNPWPQWPRICKTDYGQEESKALFGKDPRIYQTTVKRFLQKDEKLYGVETIRVEKVEGQMKKVEGSEQISEADMVLIAAGFTGCESFFCKECDLPLTNRNTIMTMSGTHQIKNSRLFVAGDAHRGQSLVVWAIADGKACAKEIDHYLMGYTQIEV